MWKSEMCARSSTQTSWSLCKVIVTNVSYSGSTLLSQKVFQTGTRQCERCWSNQANSYPELRQKPRYVQGRNTTTTGKTQLLYGPRQANLVLIAYASSEGSGKPAHPRSLARTSAAHSYKQWIKRNLQTESQIRGPSEWLGMRSWNLSWRNARRHKFAWRGSYKYTYTCSKVKDHSLTSLLIPVGGQ